MRDRTPHQPWNKKRVKLQVNVDEIGLNCLLEWRGRADWSLNCGCRVVFSPESTSQFVSITDFSEISYSAGQLHSTSTNKFYYFHSFLTSQLFINMSPFIEETALQSFQFCKRSGRPKFLPGSGIQCF